MENRDHGVKKLLKNNKKALTPTSPTIQWLKNNNDIVVRRYEKATVMQGKKQYTDEALRELGDLQNYVVTSNPVMSSNPYLLLTDAPI